MKVKIKLTISQFKALLDYLHKVIYYDVTPSTPIIIPASYLQLINLKAFLAQGYKKVIDFNSTNVNALKEKTFTVEINQMHAVMFALGSTRHLLDSYMLSVHETLKRYNKDYCTDLYEIIS